MSLSGSHPRVDQPLVSVGIPTFNRVESLHRAVDSVRGQDHRAIEIVISDNASTDGTEAACRRWAATDARIRYVRNAHNLGPTANFRQAQELCRGDYFMWLGDDDWLDPTYISSCLELLRRDPTASLAAGRVVYHRPDGSEYEPEPFELVDPDPARRLTDYVARVRDNGMFYGLAPRRARRAVAPLCDNIGNDLFLVAELAFVGRCRLVPDVRVHRMPGVSGVSLWAVARTARVSWFERLAPQLGITVFTFVHLGFRSPALRSLSITPRLLLAARASWITLRRFPLEGVVKVLRRGWPRLAVRVRSSRVVGRARASAERWIGPK